MLLYKFTFKIKVLDNLEEMDKLLKMYNLPILNQEEIENMNRPNSSNEIESVIFLKES